MRLIKDPERLTQLAAAWRRCLQVKNILRLVQDILLAAGRIFYHNSYLALQHRAGTFQRSGLRIFDTYYKESRTIAPSEAAKT